MTSPKTTATETERLSARVVWERVRASKIEQQTWPPVLRKGGLLVRKALIASLVAGACFGAGLASAQNVEVRATNVQITAGAEVVWTKGLRVSIGAAADSIAYGEKAVQVDKPAAKEEVKAEARKELAENQAEVPSYLHPPKSHAAKAEVEGPDVR